MGQFLNQIRKRLGLEPKRDKTLIGGIPNEVIISRATQNESAEVHHHITQGRMSPLTVGHEAVVNGVKKAAKAQGAGHTVILTGTHDAKKNPLSPEQKLKHAKRAFPKTNIKVSDKSRPTILYHLSDLHNQGVNHLHLHVGSDRADSFHKLIHDYNGKEGKHGYYNFKHITIHKVGDDRDEGSSGVSGASGTKMRQHAVAGNLPEFKKMAPSKMSDAHKEEMYHDVRHGMSVKEASEGYPVTAIPTRPIPTKDARDSKLKKSSLNKLPAPKNTGNIGLDSNLGDGKKDFNLLRRRSQKRFLEGYDEVSGIDAVDGLNRSAVFAPTTTPIKTSRIASKKIKSEGMFAADIANGETGESGNPNQSMEGIPTTAKENKVKKFKNVREACWTGYKQVGVKKKGNKMVPNCVPTEEVEPVSEATYKGKTVPLNKPMKGDVKKSKVYVDPDGDGKAQKVNFGDKKLSIKKNIPARKKSYCARSGGQGNLNDKTSANYWSRRAWNCEEVDYPIKEEKKFSAVRHDKSGLPKKYTAGLTSSEIKAKKAQINRNKKLSDSDPAAYKDMPGDKRMREKGIPQSKYTKAYHAKFGEETEMNEKWSQKYKKSIDCNNPKGFSQRAHCQSLKKEDIDLEETAGLADKAKKSGISIGTLQKVYRRGVAAWNSGHRPGTTPQQWGMARVNSYISKGKTYHTADKDLHEDSFVEKVMTIIERGEDSQGYYRSTESGAGLTRKGAKHFGIKTAVTTPPSKLDPNGKAAKRRKSFCARMGGMPGPMKDEKGRPTRKAMSLRRWHCESISDDSIDDEGFSPKAGKYTRGDKVEVKKDGYKGKGKVDVYDPSSDTYLISLDKQGGANLHVKSKDIKPVHEHIVKVKGGFELKSKKTGKNLGKYPTKAGAEKRERQVQYFKHMGEGKLTKKVKKIMEGKK